MTINAPALAPGQEESWFGLLDLADQFGTAGWCLSGGQLTHLHCWERGAAPNRPTNDGDAIADVRGTTAALRRITQTLIDLGFRADRETMEGNQIRWVRGQAHIDVLAPTGTSLLTDNRTANRRPTLEAPAAQQALDRSEVVEVDVRGRVGAIPRPNLLGAMISKAAAYEVHTDNNRARHFQDFAVLASIAGRRDLPVDGVSNRDRQRMTTMVGRMSSNRSVWVGVEGAEIGIERITLWLRRLTGTERRHDR